MRMVKKCYFIRIYKDGFGEIGEASLESKLPFNLKEMEKWLKEKSQKPIQSVKCWKPFKDKKVGKN